MLFISSVVSLLAVTSVSAAPTALTKRAAVDIFSMSIICFSLTTRKPDSHQEFADVLEQLESTFYSQGLAKFTDADFTAAGFTSSQLVIEQLKIIQQDEATHSTALQAQIVSLGDQPITTCKFKFDSALTDVATMAATARVVEAAGVSAYLGAAPLVTDPVLLVAAASIATVEARHQEFLNIISSSGTVIPSAFDFALKPEEVLTIALPFIDTTSPCDVGVQRE